ncbi:HAMP domain-containing sensor histidine kinase [Streptomyces sp. B6B3]|uniref:sensor histidine kinase n=1 Tax=Streptomyces sp. B6B3 TaxID=3153570 RepID=UPI00325D6049
MTGLRRLTLRTRLVLITAVLCSLGLLAANAAGLVLLRTYLMDRVDAQFTDGSEAGRLGSGDGLNAAELADLIRTDLADNLLLNERFGQEVRLYLFDDAGELLASLPATPTTPDPELPGPEELADRVGEGPFTVGGRGVGGHDWRVHVRESSDGGLVVSAASLAEVDSTLNRLLVIDAVVTGVVVLLLGLAGAWMIRLGLRPLTRMEATAGEITAGDLARRVPGADSDPRTESGRLGQAMNAMLDRVEAEVTARRRSERRLRRFLSDASHELRTPLTSIRGFAELSRRGGDRDEALVRIEAEARRMGVLVEDLLLLARLDQRPRLDRGPVDLLELAADVVGAVRVQAPDRDVSLTGRDGPPEPVTVLGDALRLRQVVSNLLANALRHTPPDASITVRVGRAAAAAGAAPSGAVVEVSDTGPGIPPEHVPHVFDRRYRVPRAGGAAGDGHEATAREAREAPEAELGAGLGLGLSIASALTAAHGGRIELDTAPGRGATFRVWLPAGPPEPDAGARPRPAADAAGAAP